MSEFFINTSGDFKERFDMSKFLEFTDNQDPLNSRFLSRVRKLPVRGQFVVTVQESRPDVLSYKIFGDTQYWWILLFFNKIQDPDQLATGDVINYFSIQELENLLFSLKAKQTSGS
jgi:hypothetical protein